MPICPIERIRSSKFPWTREKEPFGSQIERLPSAFEKEAVSSNPTLDIEN